MDSITILGSDGRVLQENELVFTCEARGGPDNVVLWTKNGDPITEDGMLTITTVVFSTYSNSTLRIASVDAARHKGNYTCHVSNEAGEDSASLVVVGKIKINVLLL